MSTITSSRRASIEDPRLRPFLSSHFNAQNYVTNIIKENRSEESFLEISTCIEEIDEEIKGYISQHKHDLMSGMQDVAFLAKRYQGLESIAMKLRGSVDKMQRETLDSYELVKSRTLELERIHETSVLLRQLRQFMHSKAQLDYHVSLDNKQDLRQLASVAKTVNDLESLLRVPQLASLKLVASEVEKIKVFGERVRNAAQSRLLSSLQDQNQAAVAECLQVFFNLQSLPEIVLLAIDVTVKATVEISSAALDMTQLIDSSGAAAVGNRSKKPSSERKAMHVSSKQLLSNPSQLRVAMREMSHHWASALQEQAVKIHVLQRVVAKKEDPVSHERFSDVLRRSGGDLSADTAPSLLASGRLVDVFWSRLSVALQDVVASKVRTFPAAAPRAYPSLRRCALDVLTAIKTLAVRDNPGRGGGLASIGMLCDTLSDDEDSDMDDDRESDCTKSNSYGGNKSYNAGLFGSMVSISSPFCVSTLGRRRNGHHLVRVADTGTTGKVSTEGEIDGSRTPAGLREQETGLLGALAPMRDRYLASALNRMNAPVLQMFPEIEGYIAAVPSKRDLMTLVKAIQDEVVVAILEGDRSLVRMLTREAIKAVQLFTTKLENMLSVGPDSLRVVFQNGQYMKTGQQEHNSELIVLVSQLRDAIHKMSGQIEKSTRDLPGATAAPLYADSGRQNLHSSAAGHDQELDSFISKSIQMADELAEQILWPLVAGLADHFRDILVGLLREGVAAPTSSTQSTRNGMSSSPATGCSRAVDTVVAQLPLAMDVHLLQLPRTPPVLAAVEELCSRVLSVYTSVACLRRPVNEQSRLLTASEISALDMMVTGIISTVFTTKPNTGPSLQEVRSFRRLIFDPVVSVKSFSSNGEIADNAAVFGEDSSCLVPAPSTTICSLPYARSLRPSTILGYFMSCGPKQLPSIPEQFSSSAPSPVSAYVTMISTPIGPRSSPSSDKVSIRHIYGGPDMAKAESEQRCIDISHACLEVYIQRVNANSGDERKQKFLREWYESLQNLCREV